MEHQHYMKIQWSNMSEATLIQGSFIAVVVLWLICKDAMCKIVSFDAVLLR